jgi:hypothetical protein
VYEASVSTDYALAGFRKWLPGVEPRSGQCEICDGQNGTGTGSFRVPKFALPSIRSSHFCIVISIYHPVLVQWANGRSNSGLGSSPAP